MNQNVIEVNKEILGGTPVFRGTRVAVQTLFDYPEARSLDEFLQGFPGVSREQAEAITELAGRVITSPQFRYEDFTHTGSSVHA